MNKKPSASLLAAGDIASCKSNGDEETAALLAKLPGTIATLGDAVYPNGTSEDFRKCFDPSWGQFKDRIRPAPGNHEYETGTASAYFDYFGAAAGPSGRGYYSYDLGDWHVVSLNSNCSLLSCTTGGAQQRWLEQDLTTSKAHCTLAYWHSPRFASGLHGSDPAMADLYATLYGHGADIVLAGHDHNFERFAPLDPNGKPDRERGLRNFVVGTGGASHYPAVPHVAGSEVLNAKTFGVLALTLSADSYSWKFVSSPGQFTDAGTGKCH